MSSAGRLQQVKNNTKPLSFQAQNVVVVTYRRWSFTRGSNCKDLTRKVSVTWITWSLMVVGCLREVVEHGGLTVLH